MKIGIIGNAHANRGRAGKFIEEVRQRCAALGFDVTLELTREPGDGKRLGALLAPEVDVIGIIGGDGTIHETINGMMPSPRPTFVMSSGTGNDYASLVAGPKSADEIAQLIDSGMGARLDIIEVAGRYCINSFGIGFEGEANRQSHKIKRIQGPLLYLIAVFKALKAMSYPEFRITAPGHEPIEGKKLMISAGNGNRTGGTFYLVPDAYPDDGMIDVALIDPIGKARLVTLLPKTFKGKHTTQPEVVMLRVPHLTIEASDPYAMHIDGEFVGDAPLKLDVHLNAGAVPILCKDSPDNRLSKPLEKILF